MSLEHDEEERRKFGQVLIAPGVHPKLGLRESENIWKEKKTKMVRQLGF
jgi:hypothetical protein